MTNTSPRLDAHLPEVKKLEQSRQALATLAEVIGRDNPGPIERDAAIHRFKYSVELVWKLGQEYLRGMHGLDLASPKSVIRALRESQMLDAGETVKALQMIDDRNLTSHTYNEALALEIYHRLAGHWQHMTTIVAAIEEELGAP